MEVIMKSLFLKILLSSIICLSSFQVMAWGKTGHRVVGKIAFNHLSIPARKAVEAILDGDSLAQVTNWPDFMRSNDDPFWHKWSVSWHYVSIPEGGTYSSSKKNPKGDIYEAINAFVSILSNKPLAEGPIKEGLTSYFGDLKNPAIRPKLKRFALSFLAHLVGDLHQPLHTGHLKDKGGNTIRLKWFGHSTNLHAIWDSSIIDFSELSYSEMVEFIDTDDKGFIKKTQNSSVLDWLNESLVLRKNAYDVPKKNLIYQYYYHNYPIVKNQLLKGGLRLAGLLNKIFTK